MGQHDEALEAIDAALEIDRANPAMFNIRGNILSNLCRYDEAIDYYQAALAIYGDY